MGVCSILESDGSTRLKRLPREVDSPSLGVMIAAVVGMFKAGG